MVERKVVTIDHNTTENQLVYILTKAFVNHHFDILKKAFWCLCFVSSMYFYVATHCICYVILSNVAILLMKTTIYFIFRFVLGISTLSAFAQHLHNFHIMHDIVKKLLTTYLYCYWSEYLCLCLFIRYWGFWQKKPPTHWCEIIHVYINFILQCRIFTIMWKKLLID